MKSRLLGRLDVIRDSPDAARFWQVEPWAVALSGRGQSLARRVVDLCAVFSVPLVPAGSRLCNENELAEAGVVVAVQRNAPASDVSHARSNAKSPRCAGFGGNFPVRGL